MELVLGWAAGMLITGILAAKRNRSVVGYIALAAIISPVLAAIVVLSLGQYEPEPEEAT
jgi:hypothetical protein